MKPFWLKSLADLGKEMNMKKQLLTLLAISSVALTGVSGATYAGGDSIHYPEQQWSFDGAFGTFDKAALQRGFKVYKDVCSSCHSLDRVYFRNFEALGYSPEQVKTIASEYVVMDGPNEEGEMFERTAKASDAFPSPYTNVQQARYVNGGALPPDLSLITKARVGGADYIYALMTGYNEAPADEELLDGQHWNDYFAGHRIAMAAPLLGGSVSYDDGSPETVEQYAKDVAHFLTWAAEPETEARKRMGVKVVLFLLIFSVVMYGVKRRVWSDLH